MKKILKVLGIVALLFIAFLFVSYLVLNEELPQSAPSEEADLMANSMLQAMNKEAWDSTKLVSWTFRGEHHYEWNRVENEVLVIWDDYEVTLNPETIAGEVKKSNQLLSGEEASEMVRLAWDYYNNDSFWLAAPYKLFDPGTERSIVTCADGRRGLKITYSSGGTTPGDSYVWILDQQNRPVACKMWVSIIPIGGIEFSWENFKTLPSGALIAQDHKALGMLNVDLKNIR